MIQATKNKAKSCSFLDAIRRCSCGRLINGLAKNRRQGKFKPCQNARDWSVRCGALCRSRLLRWHLHFESLLSLLGSLRKPLKTKFTPAVSSVYSLFLSLSLSLRVSTLEKKKSCPLSTVDPSKSSQSLSSKFILSSLDFEFNMWKSNCALDEDSAGVTVVGSRTKLGVPALTGPFQQTSTSMTVLRAQHEFTHQLAALSACNFATKHGQPGVRELAKFRHCT